MAASTASKPTPVTDDDLRRIIDEEIRTGITFDNDAKGDRRADALDYYDGIVRDLPADKGRSSVVSRDVSDVIDWMMPGIMRVFAGAGTLGVFQPAKRGDEESAAQATDYINFMLANECDGYRMLQTWIMDGLQVRNGIVKVYWDDTPEYEVEDLRNLSTDQVTVLFQGGDIKPEDILGVQPHQQVVQDPATGQSTPIDVYDIRFRRTSSNGRLRVENVPPEDFGISAKGRTIEAAPCVWHRDRMTRSDLIKQGYKRDLIDSLPAWDKAPNASDAERDGGFAQASDRGDGAMAEVEIIEAYLYADCDGDGIAESRKIVLAGASGARKILENEEWPDDRPFVDLTPQPVPHRWMGRSAADCVMDLMRVKTALWRGTLDNIYAQNKPQRLVVDEALVDPDDLLEQAFGGTIRIKKGFAASAALADLTTPDIAGNTLAAIQAVDGLIQRRTGVSQATAALDATALDPQTATAEQIEHDSSYSRVELVARNIAELAIKPLYGKMLRIVVRNQDRPRTIRLRDKWVDFDPRAWNAAMDVSVNVGLGTGSRERDLKMLAAVYARQGEIVEKLGPDNPVVKPSMMVGTLHKMVEASGLRDPETYFAEVSDDDFAQWQASRPPPPPDPRVAAVEARAQADQQKTQTSIALGRERQQADVAMDQAKMQAELQMERERLQQEYALKVDEMNRSFQLRRQEMESERQLRAAEIVTGAHSVSTNIPRQ